jgi:hypothetical protein
MNKLSATDKLELVKIAMLRKEAGPTSWLAKNVGRAGRWLSNKGIEGDLLQQGIFKRGLGRKAHSFGEALGRNKYNIAKYLTYGGAGFGAATALGGSALGGGLYAKNRMINKYQDANLMQRLALAFQPGRLG